MRVFPLLHPWFPSRTMGEEPGSVRDGFPIGGVMSDVKSSPAERENKWRRSASQTLCLPLALTPPPIPPLLAQDPLTEFSLSQQLTVCFLCSSRLWSYLCTI